MNLPPAFNDIEDCLAVLLRPASLRTILAPNGCRTGQSCANAPDDHACRLRSRRRLLMAARRHEDNLILSPTAIVRQLEGGNVGRGPSRRIGTADVGDLKQGRDVGGSRIKQAAGKAARVFNGQGAITLALPQSHLHRPRVSSVLSDQAIGPQIEQVNPLHVLKDVSGRINGPARDGGKDCADLVSGARTNILLKLSAKRLKIRADGRGRGRRDRCGEPAS